MPYHLSRDFVTPIAFTPIQRRSRHNSGHAVLDALQPKTSITKKQCHPNHPRWTRPVNPLGAAGSHDPISIIAFSTDHWSSVDRTRPPSRCSMRTCTTRPDGLTGSLSYRHHQEVLQAATARNRTSPRGEANRECRSKPPRRLAILWYCIISKSNNWSAICYQQWRMYGVTELGEDQRKRRKDCPRGCGLAG